MSDILDRLERAFESGPERIRERLAGKVTYGYCEYAPHVAARIAEDGTETFGHFDEEGKFVPFTVEEYEDFDREFKWRRTKIFDNKEKNNVIPFPVRTTSP